MYFVGFKIHSEKPTRVAGEDHSYNNITQDTKVSIKVL